MENLKFSPEHVWVKDNGDGTALIGITEFAQEQLGDLVYVELVELGTKINKGEEISVVESVKTASDVYAPVDGTIIEVNESLDDEPDLINDDPLANWIMKVELADVSDLDGLLDEGAYQNLVDEEA
jgi:glycine cleavage system H protein